MKMKKSLMICLLATVLILTWGCHGNPTSNTPSPQPIQGVTASPSAAPTAEGLPSATPTNATVTTPTPTPTASPSPTVPKGPAYVNVTKGGLNIRSAPDTSVDNFVEYLYNRDIVDIIEPNSPAGWHKVRSTGGEIGYCKAEYLTSILNAPIDQVKKDVIYIPCQEDDTDDHVGAEGTINVTLNNTPYTLYWSVYLFPHDACYSVSFAKCFLLDGDNRVVSWIPADPLPDVEDESAEDVRARRITLEEALFHDVNEDGQQDIILTWAHQDGHSSILPSPDALWSMAYGVPNMQFVYDPYTHEAPVITFSDAFVPHFGEYYFDSNMKILKEHVKKNPPKLS